MKVCKVSYLTVAAAAENTSRLFDGNLETTVKRASSGDYFTVGLLPYNVDKKGGTKRKGHKYPCQHVIQTFVHLLPPTSVVVLANWGHAVNFTAHGGTHLPTLNYSVECYCE